ncbi:MAG: hypothetical protein D6771_06020, partial [Zetaproteobacteria bacterium]
MPTMRRDFAHTLRKPKRLRRWWLALMPGLFAVGAMAPKPEPLAPHAYEEAIASYVLAPEVPSRRLCAQPGDTLSALLARLGLASPLQGAVLRALRRAGFDPRTIH